MLRLIFIGRSEVLEPNHKTFCKMICPLSPAAGFSAPRLSAPGAHLCQSLILGSLLPKSSEKQVLVLIFLFTVLHAVKFGCLAILSLTVVSRIYGSDPACDAT